MTQPFLALITPLASGGGAPVYPAHPIAPGTPPGIWGGPPLYPDQGLPQPPPAPTHPIVIPPDTIAPGVPTHPIYIPAPPISPSHPIVIPPDAIEPGVPTHPIYIPPGIWGPTDPRPSHPIAQPPQGGQPPTGAPPTPTHPITIPPAPEPEEGDKALVLVVTGEHEPIWFLVDENDHIRPPSTEPEPK
jgi:hypothetical protein